MMFNVPGGRSRAVGGRRPATPQQAGSLHYHKLEAITSGKSHLGDADTTVRGADDLAERRQYERSYAAKLSVAVVAVKGLHLPG
jgi:hypothetical protein